MRVKFNRTVEEDALMTKIVERADQLRQHHQQPALSDDERRNMIMSIAACHANGCPLKLTELLAAADEDFVHDVFGISSMIDTRTGRLTDHFHPRFAKEQ